MNCRACKAPITTAVCPYCRSVDADLLKKEKQLIQEEKARLERLEERLEQREIREKSEEKTAKLWDGVITAFGIFFLFGAYSILQPILSNADRHRRATFERDGGRFLFVFVLGVGFILWVVYRKKSRATTRNKNE